MKEIIEGVYVGADTDVKLVIADHTRNWSIVHAAKTPWHQKLLHYTGACPVNEPERYIARRQNELFLNLVDAKRQKPNIVMPMLDEAKKWIDVELMHDRHILIHCNKGHSRAPAVALWWWRLAALHDEFDATIKTLFGSYEVDRNSGIIKLIEEKWNDSKA
jgi:predicted protein tyrosine phosphatase